MEIVIVLGGKGDVQAGRREGQIGEAGGRCIDIGIVLIQVGQVLAVLGVEPDELSRLPGRDMPLWPHQGGEDAREIAATDDQVSDLVARLDTRQRQGVIGSTGRVAHGLICQTALIGHGQIDRRLGPPEAIDKLIRPPTNSFVEDTDIHRVRRIGDHARLTLVNEARRLDLAANESALNAVQCLDFGVAGAGLSRMIQDHIDATGPQHGEHPPVHLGHIHIEPVDVKVVILLPHEDDVERLGKAHFVQQPNHRCDIAVFGLKALGEGLFAARRQRRHKGIDLTFRPHHGCEQPGEIAFLGPDIGDVLARSHLHERQHIEGMAQRITRDLGLRAARIGNGGGPPGLAR